MLTLYLLIAHLIIDAIILFFVFMEYGLTPAYRPLANGARCTVVKRDGLKTQFDIGVPPSGEVLYALNTLPFVEFAGNVGQDGHLLYARFTHKKKLSRFKRHMLVIRTVDKALQQTFEPA